MKSSLGLAHLKRSSARTASRLRTIIDRIALKKVGIPRCEDQVTIYPYQKIGGQEDMIADTGLVRRIGNRANQVKFGKQPNGSVFRVAIAPTHLRFETQMRFNDYV